MPETAALMVEPQAPANPLALIQSAIDRGTPIADLGRLLDLQERWEKNEARKAFVVAMNAFKSDPPALFKNKLVSFKNKGGDLTEYWHAELGEISNAIAKSLSQHGLSHRWDIMQTPEGVIEVACVITHDMGHSERVPLRSMADGSGGKNAIQAVSSTVTYLQRYTLLAACGLAAKGQDNDGAGAGSGPEAAFLDKAQIKLISDLLQEMDLMGKPIDMKRFWNWQSKGMPGPVTALDQIPAIRFTSIINYINTERRKGDAS